MKRFILFPLLLTFFLGNGQDKKKLFMVRFGSCNVKSQDCMRQKEPSKPDWISGWVELAGSNSIKIYMSLTQETYPKHDITMGETIEEYDSYSIYKAKEYYPDRYSNSKISVDVYLKIEWPTSGNNNRTILYLYENKDGAQGYYYVCRP